MAVVYVNLHPNYNYSNIIIQDGYVAELKEYVANVDWLHWDFHSLGGKKPLVCVMGGWSDDPDAVERHLERTKVVLQRLLSVGCEIFVRDERNDEWEVYVPESSFGKTEMYEIEIQLLRSSEKEKWALAEIEKYQQLIDIGLERGIETEALLIKLLNEAKSRVDECRNTEKRRQDKIKSIW